MLGRNARGLGYLVVAVVGSGLLFLLIAAMYVGASYAHSSHPPYCEPAIYGWVPPAGALRLDGLSPLTAPAASFASFFVGLWWALGAATAGSRARRIVGVVAATVLLYVGVGLVAFLFHNPFTCPLLI